MSAHDAIHVLIVDDDNHLLEVYREMIARTRGFVSIAAVRGGKALESARRHLFDAVVIDAKLDYRGEGFGGLRLAEDLRPRYGDNAILIISQYITKDLMDARGSQFEFLDKGSVSSPRAFIQTLCQRIRAMKRRQHIFVAMPFADGYLDVYQSGIRPVVKALGLNCLRADEIAHNRPIHEVMFEALETSKLVVFLADGENANAYYEAGFADALRKEVVIVVDSLSDLKFDVKHRHTITYGGSLRVLRTELKRKLQAIRQCPPGI